MERFGPRRYREIAEYLARQGDFSVMLTFAEIDTLIGGQLPLGAVINPGWWTTGTQMHVRRWREHGWHAYPDFAHRRVRFVRDMEETRE